MLTENHRLYLHTSDPVAELQALRELIREAIAAGFYNIDKDASTPNSGNRPVSKCGRTGHQPIKVEPDLTSYFGQPAHLESYFDLSD